MPNDGHARKPHSHLPDDLDRALLSVEENPTAHVAGVCTLPFPGLSIAQLGAPVSLPLIPQQAIAIAQLATPCPTTSLQDCSCLHIPGASLTFENPEWQPAIDELFSHVICSFARLFNHYYCRLSLSHLLLHPPGTRLLPLRHNTTSKYYFATLAVILPSLYTDGQIELTHNRHTSVYKHGTSTSQHSPYFLAFYKQVEQSLKPLSSGSRLVLVYDILWDDHESLEEIPKAPIVDLGPIINALAAHASVHPSGLWSLFFGSSFRFDDTSDDPTLGNRSSLVRSGIRALDPDEQHWIVLLQHASQRAGFGPLQIAICWLKKTIEPEQCDPSLGDSWRSHAEGEVTVHELFTADGQKMNHCLDFIDWNDTRSRIQFDEFHNSYVDPHYESFDHDDNRTSYSQSTVIVVWPLDKDMELQGRFARDILCLFTHVGRPMRIDRIARLLACKETLGPNHDMAWKHTRQILRTAVKHGERALAERVLEFAISISRVPGLDWELSLWMDALALGLSGRLFYLMQQFLRANGANKVEHCREHLLILSSLLQYKQVSPNMCIEALQLVVTHVKANRRLIDFYYDDEVLKSDMDKTNAKDARTQCCSLWLLLFNTFISSKELCDSGSFVEQRRFQLVAKQLVPAVQELIVDHVGRLAEVVDWLSRNKFSDDAIFLRDVRKVASSRSISARLTKFSEMVEFIASNKIAPVDKWRGQHRFLFPAKGEEVRGWRHFIWFASYLREALRDHGTGPEKKVANKTLELLLLSIEGFRVDEGGALEELLSETFDPIHDDTLYKMELVIEMRDMLRDLRLRKLHLIVTLDKRKANMGLSLSEVQLDYPGSQVSQVVNKFMAGDGLSVCVTGFNRAREADEVLGYLRTKLPIGMVTEAGREGNQYFLYLEKGMAGDYAMWIQYIKEEKELVKMETELKKLRESIKNSEEELMLAVTQTDDNQTQSAKRLRTS